MSYGVLVFLGIWGLPKLNCLKREKRRCSCGEWITVGDLSSKTLYGFKGEKMYFLLKSQKFFT